MATYHPASFYKKMQINTSSRADLTLMLYEGAIKFCNIADLGFQQKDFEKVNNNIIKVQNIITELRSTLNFKYPVAKDFDIIYDYINSLLIQANVKKDCNQLILALDQIREMRDIWKELMKQNNPIGHL